MTFEEELKKLVEHARLNDMPDAERESAVAELHRRHGRKVPPPITGTVNITDPGDRFK